MEDIEVGEYIRTKSGIIIRVDIIDFEKLIISQKGIGYDFECIEEMEDFIKNEIVKHSKNIIDLIEVGDYVNGRKIERINDYGNHKRLYFNLDDDEWDAIYNEDIKSILTKEQYSQNCYRLEE